MCFHLVLFVKWMTNCLFSRVFNNLVQFFMGFRRAIVVLVFCWLIGCPTTGQTIFSGGSYTGRECKLPCEVQNGNVSCLLTIALILPADPRYDVSLNKVLPAIDLAITKARETMLIPRELKFRVTTQDDDCDATYAQLRTMENYSKCIHLFLGPVCDYSLANVGRVVKFLGTPLITTGGLTFDFTKKKTSFHDEFFMTIRIGTISFRDIVYFFLSLMDRHDWRKVHLMYELNGQCQIAGKHTCQLVMKSMVEFFKKRLDFIYGSVDIENIAPKDLPQILKDHVGNSYGDAFIGPVCDYVIGPVSRYAGVWNIPVLTAGAQADAFRRKVEYPTLTRMMGSHNLVSEGLKHILQEFNWTVAGLIYHNHKKERGKGNSNCYFTLSAVNDILNKNDNVIHTSFDQESVSHQDYYNALIYVSKMSRIIVMCANATTIREILIAAEELGMVDSGEYVFFSIELTSSDINLTEPWKREDDSEERNLKARKAYEALLTVTARTPDNDEYKKFSNEIKSLAQTRYNFTFGNASVTTFVTAFYDAVLLYARALNESLTDFPDNINIDGANLTRRMWGASFKGITGDVHIDENGDRIADYSLLDMNPTTAKFEIVAHYFGANKTLEYIPGKTIHWSGDRVNPPPDTPTCGFDGSLCPDNSLPGYAILSIVLSSIVIILVIASIFFYRHLKLEAEIASMTWMINWDDIVIQKYYKMKGSITSLITIGSGSQPILYSVGNQGSMLGEVEKQYQITTGIYKNLMVAITGIKTIRAQELSRSLLLELKRMKDLQHDHLVRFYGACLEPTYCCFLTEFCPKGSLQDILENDQIKLDRIFKFSLIQDIIRGMIYLHGSEIKSHGNLKSSNCVVDSRFVLKITDFGLHDLRRVDTEDDRNSTIFWKRQLWTAPELLRMARRPLEGTQKGDVYSFGIIVHEIIVRKEPFYLGPTVHMTPREIVEGVRRPSGSPLRPAIDDNVDEEVASLMRRCWAPDSADRPDFSALKQMIRKINKDYDSSNILDNLLSRMEQYANNLETLVEERTADYLEEKRKCEELLYQLLPKSVASQLILGQSVSAETYDQVTIYFSDIVGFTSLSAESDPLEIVTFLNDLYTCFDSIIENFDVYKVETIGDAYMVVSGLPVRNGNAHAREIARMSLALRDRVKTFEIRHRPHEQLKLRIGIHSGPVVAGVVGLKMPRYCLFGDTVNTASRMESNGEALKIHVSPKTKEILDKFDTFILELRGEVTLKGKGKMITYWLQGEKQTLPAVNNTGQTDDRIPAISDELCDGGQNTVATHTTFAINNSTVTGNGARSNGSSSVQTSHLHLTKVSIGSNQIHQSIPPDDSVPNHAENSANSPLLLPASSISHA